MKRITRIVFISKKDLDLMDKDINAVTEYKIFSNKEEGTQEIELTLAIPEEFKITEDVLMDIIQGLTPALTEKEHEEKFNKVIQHLRSVGASI
jgi:hypothetical protein